MKVRVVELTILSEGKIWRGTAEAEGDEVRLAGADLEAALGYRVEPRGLCRGAVCIPTAGHQGLVRDGRWGLRGLSKVSGRPLAFDRDAGVAVLGDSPQDQRERLESLEAPDFERPDLDGKRRRLTEFRGKKILLHAFASW